MGKCDVMTDSFLIQGMEKERIEGILGEVNRSHAAVTSESIKEMN
jgi:hypothetical protein